MHRYTQLFAACSALFLAPCNLFAQGISIGDRDSDGQSIQLGETDLVPSVRLDFQATDNTFRTEDDGLDSTRVILNPEVVWFAERRLLSLKGIYEGHYTLSSEDAPSFDDHLLGFTVDAELNSKNRSRAAVSISLEHDDIGLGVLSEATESDPNEVADITEIELVGEHIYGASDARGNLKGGLRLLLRDFQNQPTFTQGRDSFSFRPYAEFSYRVSADTRTLIGVQFAGIDFDNDFADRNDITIFTGLDFKATGALSGTFRVGATQSLYDTSERDDETSLFLDADLVYRPTNFARFQIGARREIDNSRGSLNSLESAINTIFTASWDHTWSSRISTRAAIEVEDFDAFCPEPSDVVTTPSFEIEYSLRRWISFGISATHEQRDASNCANAAVDAVPLEDYERVDVGAFIRGTL